MQAKPNRKPLFEAFRPQNWSEVIGQEKVVSQIAKLRERGLPGRAYWISGKSGTGKTTTARLLAAEVAGELDTVEIEAGQLTMSMLRDIEMTMHLCGMSKGGRALIVNESHGLRKDIIRRLLVWLEALPSHVVVIFTTTKEGQASLFEDYDDASPLLSRCIQLPLTSQGLAQAFATRCHEIATQEGLNGRPIADYVKLANRHKSNFRAMLQEIETGSFC